MLKSRKKKLFKLNLYLKYNIAQGKTLSSSQPPPPKQEKKLRKSNLQAFRKYESKWNMKSDVVVVVVVVSGDDSG